MRIELALQKLDAAERKYEKEPSQDTRAELAFQRKSVEQLSEREIEILRLQRSPGPGSSTSPGTSPGTSSSHKTNFLF